jgi:hypothetical protein
VTGTVASTEASVSSSTNARERLAFVRVVMCVLQLVPLLWIEPGCQNMGIESGCEAMSDPPCRTSVVTPVHGAVDTVGSLPTALYSV